VYALGLVLVECLSGRRAFEGTASELAAARLTRDVEVPSGLGDDWEQLLRSMTRRNPAARITAAQAAIEFGRLGQVVDTTLAPSIGSEQLDSTAIAATLTGEGDTAVLAATMPLPASSDVTLTSINAAPVTRGRRRRVGVWIFSALGVTAALVVGAFAADGAFSPSPGRPTSSTTSSTLPAVLATDPTTTTPSTSTTTSTTIAVPDVATAAGSLETVLQSGASDGSIASPVAQQLDLQLQPLLGASNDGNSDQQISTFDQFVQTFDQAVAAGAITSDATFANMTASINTLAEALGTTVPSTTSPATTLVPPTTSVPPGNGNGFGHGHHH
jgi:hypothetical protein